MRNELQQKDDLVAQLSEHNARLQAFSNAVRHTWTYRFYKAFLRRSKLV